MIIEFGKISSSKPGVELIGYLRGDVKGSRVKVKKVSLIPKRISKRLLKMTVNNIDTGKTAYGIALVLLDMKSRTFLTGMKDRHQYCGFGFPPGKLGKTNMPYLYKYRLSGGCGARDNIWVPKSIGGKILSFTPFKSRENHIEIARR